MYQKSLLSLISLEREKNIYMCVLMSKEVRKMDKMYHCVDHSESIIQIKVMKSVPIQ